MECQLKCLLLLNAFNVGYIGYITLVHQKGPRNSGGKPELDAGQQSGPGAEQILGLKRDEQNMFRRP